MLHIDLFSGIGGFAYAVDQVWPDAEHIFCDNDKFCQQVLRKHWPNSQIYGDIRQFIADTETTRRSDGLSNDKGEAKGKINSSRNEIERTHLLTGGFPCQPFSQAGRRKGTEDNRYLWPEMFRVIQLTKPQWVIAENVSGLVTWNNGMVLEQVCLDLEGEGYEVQPFVIPAVSVNAPHRRDRIWIIAHKLGGGLQEPQTEQQAGRAGQFDENTANPKSGKSGKQTKQKRGQDTGRGNSDWERNWLEVATELCRVDDGLSAELDGLKLSKSRHRAERLKSLGNAIVPQVAIEIMKAIKSPNQA